MPKLSAKGAALPASPIRKLVPFAEGAAQRGTEVLYLNIGQPDIPTPQVALDAVSNHTVKVLAYSHSAGFESYRRGLLTYYAQHNIALELGDVMITTGGSEALLFAMGTILDAGDEIIIPEPYYANYSSFAQSSGAVVVPVASGIEDGFALPPIAQIEPLITERTRALLICHPGNPTGYLYTPEELNQLKDLVLKHDLFLISDEVYREFVYDGKKHTSVMSLVGLEENAVLIDSVSKRYSMCGARIGTLASKNKAFMATALKFAQARLSPPTFAQIASEAALQTPASYFEGVLAEYTRRRDVLVAGLNQIPGVFCPLPSGAFYAVAQLPVDSADRFAEWILSDFSFEGATVMMAPASGFYTDPALGAKQVRLAYVLEVGKLQQALRVLAAALDAYPGTQR